MDEGQPLDHPIKTFAMLLKGDANVGAANRLSTSYNFNHSRKENETFDVATYGASANGTEGDPARINVTEHQLLHDLRQQQAERVSLHLFARDAAAHGKRVEPRGGYGHRVRAELPVRQSVLHAAECRRADLAHAIEETTSRSSAARTPGRWAGEWMHTLNDQVFRGFFTGRYLFESVEGFLRYTSPAAAGGFGPQTVGLLQAAST